ncbi:MAG TPA: ABC transporter ATP-binding protein [Thermoanaerobaculia bacterium]|jgi:ABC-type polysaccharide/polyol phosphate transport system ATPase subunit
MAEARPVAIAVERVTKLYRRHRRRGAGGTIKSAIVSAGAAGGARTEDGAVAALTDVTLRVTAGETLGVVGANGSGKSTLLKLLAGILRPTSGQVRVSGRLAALLELGAGFHPEISGRENIEVAGLLLGLSKREIAARLPEIVRFAGIQEFLDAPVKTYSSGMAVRLGFAVAAHSDPDVLLVDEVLAVGDEAFAHKCLEKFSEFERDGKTLVFVSHDLALVSARCRRAVWLDRGRISADGAAAETVARYREHVARAESEERLAGVGVGALPSDGRIGSGRARLEAVRLCDASGRETRRLRSGEAASVEIEVSAEEPVTDFVFGVAIATVAGAPVLGVNTLGDGIAPEALSGAGRVRLELPAVALAPGLYSLDAAVHAADGAPYDSRRDVLRFEVTGGPPTLGVWSPPRRWSAEGGVRWKR